MSINDLFKKANNLFKQNNHIEGLKIYKDIFSKYPQNVRLSDEVKKTTKKYKQIINQTISDLEISNFFDMQKQDQGEIVIKHLNTMYKKNHNDILIISLLGTFYSLEKNYDKAIYFQKKAIEKAPFELSFYQNLAITLRQQDKNIDALSMLYFAKILSLNNKSIDFEIAKLYTLIKNYKASDFILSNLIKDKDLTEEIIHHYCMNLIDWKKESQAILFLKKINNYTETKNLLLGLANYKLNNFESAKICFLEAIKVNKNSFVAYSHLGNCYLGLGFLDKAENCQKKSLKISPKNSIAMNNLGAFWYFTGNSEEAEKIFIESIKENAYNHEAKYFLALCQLAKSNYKQGWSNYSSRWLYKNFDSFIFKTNLPKFTLDTHSKNLIIWDEQGIGDTVLFLRFLKDIKPLVNKLYISMDKRLHPIIHRIDPDILFYDKKEFNPKTNYFDHQMPIGDLGPLFVKDNSYFSKNKKSYIISNKQKNIDLESKLKEKNKFKCGISWQSVNRRIGLAKSLTLDDLKPILALPNITFIDLQYNDTKKERENFYHKSGIEITKIKDLDNFNDIDGVISLIDICDFVITISNSNAHFSGALGKETYLLLPNGKGKLWYWTSSNNKSIWYPSVEIIEQEKPGSWNKVIKKLEQKVREKVE